MREHTIRLRGGWELEAPPADPRRVTLPLLAAPCPIGKVRFLRGFQRPRLDAERESLELELRQTPGLLAVWLNDRLLEEGGGASPDRRIPISEFPVPRNRLVLLVDLETAAIGAGREWGSVSLIIVAREEPVHPTAPICPDARTGLQS